VTLQLTLISPKRKHQRQCIITVVFPTDIDKDDFTIRLNGIVPATQPHNIPNEVWRIMRRIHRQLHLTPGHTILVEPVR